MNSAMFRTLCSYLSDLYDTQADMYGEGIVVLIDADEAFAHEVHIFIYIDGEGLMVSGCVHCSASPDWEDAIAAIDDYKRRHAAPPHVGLSGIIRAEQTFAIDRKKVERAGEKIEDYVTPEELRAAVVAIRTALAEVYGTLADRMIVAEHERTDLPMLFNRQRVRNYLETDDLPSCIDGDGRLYVPFPAEEDFPYECRLYVTLEQGKLWIDGIVPDRPVAESETKDAQAALRASKFWGLKRIVFLYKGVIHVVQTVGININNDDDLPCATHGVIMEVWAALKKVHKGFGGNPAEELHIDINCYKNGF